jgi:hypothetical protein
MRCTLRFSYIAGIVVILMGCIGEQKSDYSLNPGAIPFLSGMPQSDYMLLSPHKEDSIYLATMVPTSLNEGLVRFYIMRWSFGSKHIKLSQGFLTAIWEDRHKIETDTIPKLNLEVFSNYLANNLIDSTKEILTNFDFQSNIFDTISSFRYNNREDWFWQLYLKNGIQSSVLYREKEAQLVPQKASQILSIKKIFANVRKFDPEKDALNCVPIMEFAKMANAVDSANYCK